MPGPVAAIIPAAGEGSRLRAMGDLGPPKAFRDLAGRTLIQRAVDLLADFAAEVVVAVPAPFVDQVRRTLGPTVTVVAGGASRQRSVQNALAAVSPSATQVLVHDAARALVPPDVVRRVLAALDQGAVCVVPVIAVSDSLRALGPDGSNRPVDRAAVRLVQTPQGFAVEALRRAHEHASVDTATDDASLVEALGETVRLVDGDPVGFKITRPLDLILAEALLATGGPS